MFMNSTMYTCNRKFTNISIFSIFNLLSFRMQRTRIVIYKNMRRNNFKKSPRLEANSALGLLTPHTLSKHYCQYFLLRTHKHIYIYIYIYIYVCVCVCVCLCVCVCAYIYIYIYIFLGI